MPDVRTARRGRTAAPLAGLLAVLSVVCSATVVLAPAAEASPSCAWAAHRGYKAHAIENSLGAFRAAVGRRADYLEMDVQVTRDGRFALMHDQSVDRTTDGRGRVVDKTWAQLRELRLNDGQRVPSLGAVLAMAKPSGSDVLLELKWIPTSRWAALARVIEGFGRSRVVVNSFSPYVAEHFHARYPGVRAALDTGGQISVAQARAYGGVMPDWRKVSDTWLARMKSSGVSVYLWTVDTPQAWSRFRGKVTVLVMNRGADYDSWRSSHC